MRLLVDAGADTTSAVSFSTRFTGEVIWGDTPLDGTHFSLGSEVVGDSYDTE